MRKMQAWGIVFAEMKIQGNLVFKKSTRKFIGYTEIGDLNEEINDFSVRFCSPEADIADISNRTVAYVNVLMIRGMRSQLCPAFGYHASTGFTVDQLFLSVWETTRILECVGFKARTWVCDGASHNCKFFKINHFEQEAGIMYSTAAIFEPSRKIYFVSDEPNLLKTTANNLENSHGNLIERNLFVSWIMDY